MAENKQYILQPQEKGTVLISEDVISTIVMQAVSEVEGVMGFSTKPGTDIAEIIGKKHWGKGIKITTAEDDALIIDCNIIIVYGQSVVAVAKAAQDAAVNALESMANIKNATINVNVCGIGRL